MIHTVMQHIDLTGGFSPEAIASQADSLELRQILLPGQAATVDCQLIADFFASGLGQRLSKACQVWREMPFSLMLPAEKFYAELTGCGEQIFVQGVIDCLFAEDDGLVLLDYKTDRAGSTEEFIAKYSVQLSMYAAAVERILGRPVKERYLYTFALGRVIRLETLG